MIYAIVGGAKGNTGGSAPFQTATTSAFSSIGATVIFVCVGSHTGTPIQTPTDNQSNTYVAASAEFSQTAEYLRWYYCVNPTTNANHTVTISGTQNPSIGALAYTGNSATPAGSSNSNGATLSTTCQTGTLTPANSGSLLLAACTTAFGNITDIDNGGSAWTMRLNQVAGYGVQGLAVADFNPAGSGAQNPEFELNGSVAAVIASIIEFLPAGGGGGGRIFKLAGEGGGLAGPSRGLVARGAQQQWSRRQSGLYVPQKGA